LKVGHLARRTVGRRWDDLARPSITSCQIQNSKIARAIVRFEKVKRGCPYIPTQDFPSTRKQTAIVGQPTAKEMDEINIIVVLYVNLCCVVM